MGMSITDYYSDYYAQSAASAASGAKTGELESKLGNLSVEDSSDEELMEACKEFEAYLVEQVIKQVKESMLDSEEDESDYLKFFGDTMVQNVAATISDTESLGIAQSLYESMKNNLPSAAIIPADEASTETIAENTVTVTAQQTADLTTTESSRESIPLVQKGTL